MSPRSLDPGDWDAFRALAHRVLDDAVSHLETVRERPVWRPFPEAARAALRRPLPRTGVGAEAAYREAAQAILPYAIGNVHPRFWGWVRGTGTAEGMLAELIIGALNTSAWGGQQAAPFVESQVLGWLKDMVGFPAGASGVLVSGCSMANLVALAAARDARSGVDVDVTEDGLLSLRERPVLYASSEAHSSIEKAVGVLGLGRHALRRIPVDERFRIRVDLLRERIAADRAARLRPIAVVGSAGTVNTGAMDDLGVLADLCAAESLWFHVDGAFGALAALSPELRPLLAGMERADSLAFDLHKWLHVPYDCGVVLVRDADAHERPFHAVASYLEPLERGAAAGPEDYSRLGPELSRRFRAFKVWMAIMTHGSDAFGALIEQNCAQARDLAAALQATGVVEVLAPVSLNIVCFRYRGSTQRRTDATTQPAEGLNRLNRQLLMALQERAIAVPSGTMIGDAFAIRVAITNHRSRAEDFAALVDGVVTIGGELSER